jgi:hypothetical protein
MPKIPTVASRAKVMHGNAKKTCGGLQIKDLKYNKKNKIVSRAKSNPIRGHLKDDEFYCLSCKSRQTGLDIKERTTKRSCIKFWI